MLTRIRLQNFRGFDEHELPIEPITLTVGRNNAGKSSIIEALRFIALATNRYQTVQYIDPPGELDLPDTHRGVSPSLREFDFDRINLFFRYRDPPALIEAHFDNGASITIYLSGSEEIFVVIRNRSGQIIQSQPQARYLKLPKISIMPQVTPVADSETPLNDAYVRRSVSGVRTSIRFRNELRVFSNYFSEFKRLCEESWPRLQIRELATGRGESRNELELYVRDEDFVGDVRWMGHGLQIWLQTMWFLARVGKEDIIVLDEPDVYLHADLQRKLIRLLKRQDRQSIIVTHSVEMMAEVEPKSN